MADRRFLSFPTSPLSVLPPPNLYSDLAELIVVYQRHQIFYFLCALVEAVALPYQPLIVSLSSTLHLTPARLLMHPENQLNLKLIRLNHTQKYSFLSLNIPQSCLFLGFIDMIFPPPKTVFFHVHTHTLAHARTHAYTCTHMHTHTHTHKHLLPLILLILQVSQKSITLRNLP